MNFTVVIEGTHRIECEGVDELVDLASTLKELRESSDSRMTDRVTELQAENQILRNAMPAPGQSMPVIKAERDAAIDARDQALRTLADERAQIAQRVKAVENRERAATRARQARRKRLRNRRKS